MQSSENIFRRGRSSSNEEGHERKLGEQVRAELEPRSQKGEQRWEGPSDQRSRISVWWREATEGHTGGLLVRAGFRKVPGVREGGVGAGYFLEAGLVPLMTMPGRC